MVFLFFIKVFYSIAVSSLDVGNYASRSSADNFCSKSVRPIALYCVGRFCRNGDFLIADLGVESLIGVVDNCCFGDLGGVYGILVLEDISYGCIPEVIRAVAVIGNEFFEHVPAVVVFKIVGVNAKAEPL